MPDAADEPHTVSRVTVLKRKDGASEVETGLQRATQKHSYSIPLFLYTVSAAYRHTLDTRRKYVSLI